MEKEKICLIFGLKKKKKISLACSDHLIHTETSGWVALVSVYLASESRYYPSVWGHSLF